MVQILIQKELKLSIFDGDGFITSVVFKNETIVTSENYEFPEKSISFKMILLKEIILKCLSKMVYSF